MLAGVAQLVEHQPSKLPAHRVSSEKANTSETLTDNTSLNPSSKTQNDSNIDLELKVVVEAWPKLSAPIRAGIVAMVKGFKGGGG